MQIVASYLLMLPLVLLCLCAGCAGSKTTHETRTLTCLGFCNETAVKHETAKPAAKPEIVP